MIDLHTHSNYSDGAFPPQKVVELAKEKGVEALAISDHDSGEGIKEAKEAGKKLGIEILEAIEFSTTWDGKELHILGYGLDYNHKLVKDYIEEKRERNIDRVKKVVDRFNEIGFEINFYELNKFKTNNLKRVHVINFLLADKKNRALLQKYFKDEGNLSVDIVWKHFLLPGKPAYIPAKESLPSEVIPIIHQTGGVAVLAHPGLVHWQDRDSELFDLIEVGIDGLECFYSEHNEEKTSYFISFCEKHDWLITGGTDFHGGYVHPSVDIGVGKGNMNVPYEYFEKIKQKFGR